MGYQIDMRGFNPGGRTQSFFHVMLAGCARHAQHRQHERLCRECTHLMLQLRGIAGLGQSRDGEIGGRRILFRSKTRCSYPDLVHNHSFDSGKCLADAADAGAAVHSVNMQCKFRHNVLPLIFDDTPVRKMQEREYSGRKLVGQGFSPGNLAARNDRPSGPEVCFPNQEHTSGLKPPFVMLGFYVWAKTQTYRHG